ncbi:M23 family metallopeptidase [Aureibacillus halotolerans]|uniref:Peptidase M23-like protein n=1 Tax=Aureibacillus halotolerans TaxID=1508390 RepID=A0A4R6UD75_9BACI|nr:M23 family metallopeptidase [Aureibacillus halotolerans]TDQ41054.1 peptidase M23-like protein [Aureibacillus halotolerans]
MTINQDSFGSYFLNGEFERIYKSMSKDLQNLITPEQLHEVGHSFNEGVESYGTALQNEFLGGTRTLWLDESKTKSIHVTFDRDALISGLAIKPYVSFPTTDKRYSKNTYRMPIQKEWFVFWGGTNEFVNYHYPYEQQRYAYDLVMVKDNKTYKDTTFSNDNYYAFGADVVAPYEGKVVSVVDGIRDNVPGEMETENPAGNHTIIAHPNNEYSMIAHFKKGTIVVEEGEEVQEGQFLGQCGNSGNSSEAHIHFQLMDHANPDNAASIRIHFQNNIEPIQGDVIQPQESR